MNFRDKGIVIAKRFLREHSCIITVFTENHGLYSGVARDSAKKNGSVYQVGNLVDFFWSARLHEHIGSTKCELIKSYSGLLITNKTALYAFNSLVALIKLAFHEREPHNRLFPTLQLYLDKSVKNFSLYDYVKLELDVLTESGYGLNLDSCAVSGNTEELYYVSPRSGRAVSKEAGLPFAGKLLLLPKFLTVKNMTDITDIGNSEKKQAFELTTYFINRYFCNNISQKQALTARQIFIEHALSAI